MLQGLHSHHWNNPASYQPSIFGNFFQTQKYLPYSRLGQPSSFLDTRAKGQARVSLDCSHPCISSHQGRKGEYPGFLLHKFKALG